MHVVLIEIQAFYLLPPMQQANKKKLFYSNHCIYISVFFQIRIYLILYIIIFVIIMYNIYTNIELCIIL